MRKNNIIRPAETSSCWRLGTVFLVLSFLMIESRAYSQETGFAGEDKSVYLDSSDEAVMVRIGKSDHSDDVYYKWIIVDKPEIADCYIDDERSSNPIVTIYNEGEYIFQCTQISKYGYRNEYVLVKVSSKVDILDVKMKPSKCFYNGTTITRDDFEFVTEPPGCEDVIEIVEGSDILNKDIKTVWPIYNHEVKFATVDGKGNYHESHVTCKIPVIDDEKMVNHKDFYWDKSGKSMPIDVEENVELIAESVGGLNRIHCLTEPSYILPPAIYTMVNPNGVGTMLNAGIAGFNLIKTVVDALGIIPVGVSFGYNSKFDELGLKLKCENAKVYPEIYFSGKLSASLSVGVDAGPITLVPGLGIYLSGSIGLNVEMDKTDGEPLNPNNGDIKIPMSFVPNLYVGATAAVINPSVLSATAGVLFDFKIDTHLNFNKIMKRDEKLCSECWEMSENGIDFDDFYVTFWLRSSATAISFQIVEYKFKLCDIHSINQLTF